MSALRGDEPGAQIEGGDGLREVVVGAGLHTFEHVLVLAQRRREQSTYV